MKHNVATIDESYALCHAAARRAGSNFYPCFMVLPKPKRRAMEAIYAFMRHTDDLGDRPAEALAGESALDALRAWRAALERALQGELNHEGAMGGLPALDDAQAGNPIRSSEPERILPAVADTVRRFNIPSEHLHAVIDGVEMDLEGRRYETFDELAAYCHRVASAVGLACVHIWGFRGDEPRELARACGLAFQLTNILRDLHEDVGMGRVYLPDEDLRQCGYSVEALRRGESGQAFLRLMEMETARAKAFYREGADLLDRLEPAGQRIFGMMLDSYHRLLCRVAGDPGAVFTRRVRLGRLEKMRIAARWMLLPPRRRALP